MALPGAADARLHHEEKTGMAKTIMRPVQKPVCFEFTRGRVYVWLTLNPLDDFHASQARTNVSTQLGAATP